MRFVWWVVGSTTAVLLSFGCFAQTVPDDPKFSTGAIIEPDASFAARPRTPIYRAFLPVRVDLSRYFPMPGDQGQQGSCVAWAVGYAARAYYALSLEHRPGRPSNIPSPAYIYNSVAVTPGDCRAGSTINDALDLLKTGSLSLADAPYSAARCTPPTVAERSRAIDFKISSWSTVDPKSPDQVKGELAQGHPVIIGMLVRPALYRLRGDTVYSSSEPYVLRKSGPQKGEPSGHAMTVVGYDEVRHAFRLINSWGREWGSQGYGWISYSAFVDDVKRAYVMRLPAGVSPPAPPSPSPQPRPAPPPFPVTRISFDFVRCGLVDAVETSKGLEVRGFVGTAAELDLVKERGVQLKAVKVDVAVRKWPQCEALTTLARGLRADDRPRIKVMRPADDAALSRGSEFLIEVDSPATPSFLHVAYIQSDGKAVHLVQAEATSLAATPPRSKLILGDGRNGGPKFTVSPPFGEEIVIVVASRAPLFAERRPTEETEREFLSALRSAVLARPDPSSPARAFAADYDAVVTVERKP